MAFESPLVGRRPGIGRRRSGSILNDSFRDTGRLTLNSSAQAQQLPKNSRAAPPGDDGYSGEVRAAWIEFLNILPSTARILDVGIGNHVAALVAAELAIAQGRDWRIESLDPEGAHADRKSGRAHAHPEPIVFHSGATFARFPCEDASFDAVCGHHAIEFTDTGKTLAEVHRVLKPGGDAQFLLHHADSPLARSARMALREADLVFNQTKAFRRLHKLVTMGQIVPGSTERATNEVREVIRALKRGLPVAQAQGGGRVLTVALDAIQQLLAGRRDARPDVAGLAVDRAEADLRASVRRLGDLVTHARADADMRLVEQAAAALGFTQVERAVLQHGAEPMAWQLLAHRP